MKSIAILLLVAFLNICSAHRGSHNGDYWGTQDGQHQGGHGNDHGSDHAGNGRQGNGGHGGQHGGSWGGYGGFGGGYYEPLEAVPDKSVCSMKVRREDRSCGDDGLDLRYRFYYDTVTNRCKIFIGCKPETPGNNFQYMWSCINTCASNTNQQMKMGQPNMA